MADGQCVLNKEPESTMRHECLFRLSEIAFSAPPCVQHRPSFCQRTSLRNVSFARPSFTKVRRPGTSKCRRVLNMAASETETEDPVTRRVRGELAADGINLDELLNAGKVVSLTRKLDKLSLECDQLSEGSQELQEAKQKISKLETDLVREKRQVMQDWLKKLFLLQAFLFIGIGGILANDVVPGVESVPLVGRALGFWSVWLFTIPALRARKGTSKTEKSALNIAFLATPLLNVALPALTRNCGVIWAADIALLGACYAFYGIRAKQNAGADEDDIDLQKEQGRVKGILKYLDWGSWR